MEKLEQFRQLGLSANSLTALHEKGFENPTPIQTQTIPIILNSKIDLIGQAQTGTGKTAAFGLPILELIAEKHHKIQALILAPTRELSIQIAEELNSLKGKKKVNIVPIYGGQSIDIQLKKLKSNVEIVVGTPGRVNDMIRKRALVLNEISYLVLDEADEMLNMGFIEEVEEIMKNTNDNKRTFLFCATFSKAILKLTKKYLKEHEFIQVKSEKKTINLTDQLYFQVEESDKMEALCRIIDFEINFYGMVFCRTKIDVDKITKRLIDRGYEADCIHGDITQSQREKVLHKFKTQKINILIATDVAARGIDVQNLTHVINYSMPYDPESYVHRIGRTGRAGNEGTAITFVTRKEGRYLTEIIKFSGAQIRKANIPKISEILETKVQWIKDEILNFEDKNINQTVRKIAKELSELADTEDLLTSLLQIAFGEELNVSDYSDIKESREKFEIKSQTRLFIALGKKNGMTKRSIVQYIIDNAKTHESKINNVEVFDNFSYISVPFQEAEIILSIFKKKKKGQKSIIEKASEKSPKKKY
jgi:ATP-dependent RNA helicase DeaD